jgi:hypothetical protein
MRRLFCKSEIIPASHGNEALALTGPIRNFATNKHLLRGFSAGNPAP